MARRGNYSSASYSIDVKAALGAIGQQLRVRGWTVREVVKILDEAGYAVGEETVRRWTDRISRGQPIISDAKQTGARKKLDFEERQVATGWVLSQDKKVDLRRYSRFVNETFDTQISPSTASRYLSEFELSRQMLGSRPRDVGVSFSQYVQEGYDYVVGLHNSGFFLQDPNLVWAVDFKSTAIKQQRYHTYGPKGGKQQKYTKVQHIYTDNIFTAVGLDGSIIEPHAFTHNPELHPGSAIKDELCQKYDVDPETVVYCPDAKNWVGESADMVYTVVKKYSWEGCHVVHDDGTAWRPKGSDIFEEYKAARVTTMPSNPHGEISPNDNKYHSIAKMAERASRDDDATDAEITIRTLYHLGAVSAAAIRSFWTCNFLLDREKLTLAAYTDMIKGNKNFNSDRQRLHGQCIEAFDRFDMFEDEHE